MKRIQETLKELASKGYEISTLKELKGGVNSAVFKARTKDDMNYALKLYPLPTKLDRRNRCVTEARFLNYLKECGINTIPVLRESNPKARWALLSWIEGIKPEDLKTNDIEQIVRFIYDMNKSKSQTSRLELNHASEACISLTAISDSIAERIQLYESISPRSDIDHKAILWITTNIKPKFNKISKNLIDTQERKSHWKDLSNCRIASPSDVGIHNMLRAGNQILFLDFEYAGLDDLSKLAADWILQPEHRLSKVQEESLSNMLLTEMEEIIGITWRERLNDIKPLIHIKWCLIMLNKLHIHKLKRDQLERTIEYYESVLIN